MGTEKKVRAAGGRKYLAALAVFLLFMYVMTFVEHWFEQNRTANADSCTLNRAALAYRLEGTGTVEGEKIRAYLTPDENRMLAAGDKMQVQVSGGSEMELEIAELFYHAKENLLTVLFDIPGHAYAQGAQVRVYKDGKTKQYDCLPIEAVRQDKMGNYYVYLVREKKSILGNETVCRMKYVNVIAGDEKNAAVALEEGGVVGKDIIVYHADREITDGCRVHLIE